jgi:succinoglycan biosynthesis transport protein ExoP
MEEQSIDLKEFLGALRRRKKQIATTAGILLVLAIAVAFLLPPVYRSTATILIEEQEIPPELVRSTITSYADQRIQVISQQVMTRANLMQIIEKYDLYAAQRRRETSEDTLERLRKNIRMEMLSADVIDRARGVKTTATIAFTLSFDGETPDAAQKVTNELVSLYLNENLKARRQMAAEASSFLAEEADRLSRHISELETKLAAFKAKNFGRLPELTQLNLQLRDRADSEVMEAERQISVLQQQKGFLESQLTQIKPNSPIFSASGERVPDASDQLNALEAKYASLSGIYSPQHPDLVKMRREIASLKKETGQTGVSVEEAKQLSKLKVELATMRERYSDEHPDVLKLKRSIAALEEAQKRGGPVGDDLRSRKPDNPAYLSVRAQLDNVENELKTMRAKREELVSKRASYETRLQQTPEVEREYLDLTRDRESTMHQYQDIKAKEMEAQVSQQLEKDSKGERLSLIDPPQLPEKPHSPNRPAILLLGFILSLGGGVGYASVMESMDTSIRGAKALAGMTKAPVLAMIPYMENARDQLQKRKTRRLTIGVIVALCLLALTVIHLFVIPLDVLWFKVLRRLAI